MRVLVACEFSGIVRDAFTAHGHDAWSCDLLDSERPGQHYRGDVRNILDGGWDLMVAHPPCRYLSYAGARWWRRPGRAEQTEIALDFFRELLNAPIPRIAVENPRGVASVRIRKPDDCIQPYQFGDPYSKRTYLWLKNLPGLMATLIMSDFDVNWTSRVAHGSRQRSRTFPGIASAMAIQWGG